MEKLQRHLKLVPQLLWNGIWMVFQKLFEFFAIRYAHNNNKDIKITIININTYNGSITLLRHESKNNPFQRNRISGSLNLVNRDGEQWPSSWKIFNIMKAVFFYFEDFRSHESLMVLQSRFKVSKFINLSLSGLPFIIPT